MRPWTERVYGIPPEQIIGSQIAMKYEVKNGTLVLMREPEIAFIDDKAGKPAGIQRHIGRLAARPRTLHRNPDSAHPHAADVLVLLIGVGALPAPFSFFFSSCYAFSE